MYKLGSAWKLQLKLGFSELKPSKRHRPWPAARLEPCEIQAQALGCTKPTAGLGLSPAFTVFRHYQLYSPLCFVVVHNGELKSVMGSPATDLLDLAKSTKMVDFVIAFAPPPPPSFTTLPSPPLATLLHHHLPPHSYHHLSPPLHRLYHNETSNHVGHGGVNNDRNNGRQRVSLRLEDQYRDPCHSPRSRKAFERRHRQIETTN
ncbi:hypothetical protein CPC08DRAFT_730841 [Agrocybe pediades]|nr:hypothetical protein CPC08DRAFT_730841 [Agrocybe pediades]